MVNLGAVKPKMEIAEYSHGTEIVEPTMLTGGTETPALLPEGWKEYYDENSGCKYYSNGCTSQWERPCPPKSSHLDAPSLQPIYTGQMLPPGWTAIWQTEFSRQYYADVETQTAQWEAPPTYVHGDWSRGIDQFGQAFWASKRRNISFYENEASD